MSVALGRVELKLVGLPEKSLKRDAMRRLRFVVHATGLLHSMDALQLHHGFAAELLLFIIILAF